MAYVYMKSLEKAPENYDKIIKKLSWGKIDEIRRKITELVGNKPKKILEIGVGTGS